MSTPMSNDVGDVYIPQVMSFADSGISELVLTDEFHIYGEVKAVIVIRDAERRIVGFQWFTKDIENAGEKRAEQAATALSSQAAEIAELRMALEEIASKDTTGYGRPVLGRIAREALAQHALRRAVALTRMAKLSEAQMRLLERLGKVEPGFAYECGGHQAGTGFTLVRKGLAEHLGNLRSGLRSAFRITEAGRRALAKNVEG